MSSETVGSVIDYVAGIIRRTDKDSKDQLLKRMNILAMRMARLCSWELLRDQTDLSTGSDTDGVWLPSDLAGIDKVIRRSDTYGDIEFLERTEATVQEYERTYRYTRYRPASVVAFTADDVVLAKNSTTFTSTLMSAETEDYTDEYIRFGEETGFYKLTDNTTFTPTYNGPSFAKTRIEVRPENTQKIIFYDPDEEYYGSETLTLYYWRYPAPLYERDQQIPFPTARALQLELLVDAMVMMRTDRQADRFRAELKNEAWPEVVAMNSPRGIPFHPKDVVNNTFTCNRDYFKDRYD